MRKFSAISRVLAMLLVVCLCSAFVPVMTFAADVTPGIITITSTEGEFVLNETENSATIGEGTATYDVANNKVTLTNVVAQKIVFAMNGDFNVDLVGDNVFDVTALTDKIIAFEVSSGNVTINGLGSLTAKSGSDKALSFAANATIAGGNVTATSESSHGAYSAATLKISGGNVDIRSNGAAAFQAKSAIVENADTKLLVYSKTTRCLNANTVLISGGDVKTWYPDEEGNPVVSLYGITSTAGDLTITGGKIDARVVNNSAICKYSTDTNYALKILGGDIYAEANGNVIVSKANTIVKNCRIVVKGLTGQGAVRNELNGGYFEIDNAYIYAESTGNTIRSNGTLTISGAPYDEATGKGTYIYASGKDYAFWGSETMTVNGGTLVASGTPGANYAAIGGKNYVQNGGDFTVDVTNGLRASFFSGNVTINGGSMDVSSAGGPAFHLSGSNTGLFVNGGSLTGSVGSLMTQSKVTYVNTINVSPYAEVDMTFSSAAFTGENITVNDEGVVWEEGKELVASATAAKNIPVVTFDTEFTASVTVNDKAHANQTVALYKDGEQIATAVTDEKGIATFTIEGVSAGDVLNYTLKQIATDADGYVYDVAEREISVLVNEDATTTVTGDTAFKNIYKFITVTTEDGEVTFGDTEGDDAATTVEIGEGTISYNADNGKVVLNNITAISIVVNVRKDIVLEVVGENTFTSTKDRNFRVYNGSVTVEGEGTLNVTGLNYVINIDNGSWIQNGVTVNSNTTNGSGLVWAKVSFVLNAGSIYGTAVNGTLGIYGDYVEINDGVIDIDLKANGINSNNEDIVINGGDITVDVTADYALRSNYANISILGGTVKLSAVAPKNYGVIGDGSMTLTIGPKAKLIAVNNGGAGKVSNAEAIIIQDGVKFVTGFDDFNASTKVETLVEGEKDYNLPGNADIVVNVTLNGEADNGREVQLLKDDEVIATATVADGKVTFPVSVIGEGEYTYTVKVVGENGNGYTFAEAQTVTLTVAQNGTTVAPEEITLANTFVSLSADVTLSATVNGNRDDVKANVTLTVNEQFVETITDASGKVEFATLQLTDGTYICSVRQTSVNGAGWTYDPTAYTIIVTVENGVATIEGEAIFNNVYEAAPTTADADLLVSLSGATLKEGAFTFELLKDGNVVATVTNDAEGNVVFKDIEITEAGEIVYVARQVVGDVAGVTYDEREIVLTFLVEDWGEGYLDVCGMDCETRTFTNTYKAASVTATIGANVTLNGEVSDKNFVIIIDGEEIAVVDGKASVVKEYTAAGTYYITLTQKNTGLGGVTYDNAECLVTVTVTDNGEGQLVAEVGENNPTFANTYKAASTSASFDVLVNLEGKELEGDEFHVSVNGVKHYVFAAGKETFEYTYDEVGVYTYEIYLVLAEFNAGITMDTDKEIVTVTVTDNGEGQLVATVDKANVVFDNTYKAVAGATNIKAQVNLTGRDLVAGEIKLVLTGGNIDGEQVIAVDETGAATMMLTFTEAGTYTFTLAQTCASNGVTLDEAKTFTVTALESNGTIVAIALNNSFTFNNTYDYVVDTDIVINATVSVTDRTLAVGDIIANLLKGEEIIATAMIDAEGKISFTIDASKDMAGVYTIALSTEIAGITLPEAQTITVTVVDNGDGTATVTATATEIAFQGSYKAPTVVGEIKDVNGKLTYVSAETGKGIEMGLVKIGNDYYYAGPNGVLVVNQKYYAWKLNENSEFADGWYAFGEDGKMIKDGIFNGYFYENYRPTEKGLIKIDNDYYYAGPNGKLVTNQKYYAWKALEENSDLPVGHYYFDAEGKMIGSSAEGEIVEINGSKYFYRSGKPADMGLFKYEGNYYVAQYNGLIITAENYTQYGEGRYYVWKIHESANGMQKGWYFFDAEGKMIVK